MSIAEQVTRLKTDFDEVKADGIAEGRQAEYDAFWDVFQNYGNPTNYYFKFSYDSWTDENFNPKYPIVCNATTTGGMSLFHNNKAITDTKVPIEVTGSTAGSMFYQMDNLVTVRKLKVHESVTFTSTFLYCKNLANITFDGVIGQSIDFAISPLTAESVQSLIDHLKDLTGQTAKTVTFSSAVRGNLTDAQATEIWERNWSI